MTSTKTRRAPRFTATQDDNGRVVLTVHIDCALGEAGSTREFWVPSHGGYVREISEGRPGTLGYQVCDRLSHSGSTLETTEEALLGLIRREASAALRAEDRELAAW